VDFAVGETRPDLTLLFQVSPEVSAQRLRSRQANLPFVRDRIEESDRAFFERVASGYERIAQAEPQRVTRVDGSNSLDTVQSEVWRIVEPKVAALLSPSR
jgi:dTMP kinase